MSGPAEPGRDLLRRPLARRPPRAAHPRERSAMPAGGGPPPRRPTTHRTESGQRRPGGRSADAIATDDPHRGAGRRRGTVSRNEPKASTRSRRTPGPDSCRPRVPDRLRRHGRQPTLEASTPSLPAILIMYTTVPNQHADRVPDDRQPRTIPEALDQAADATGTTRPWSTGRPGSRFGTWSNASSQWRARSWRAASSAATAWPCGHPTVPHG